MNVEFLKIGSPVENLPLGLIGDGGTGNRTPEASDIIKLRNPRLR
jgi:hypothetical protein